jgi:hypothetical protein
VAPRPARVEPGTDFGSADAVAADPFGGDLAAHRAGFSLPHYLLVHHGLVTLQASLQASEASLPRQRLLVTAGAPVAVVAARLAASRFVRTGR